MCVEGRRTCVREGVVELNAGMRRECFEQDSNVRLVCRGNVGMMCGEL